MEYISCEERVMDLWFFSLEKTRLRGDLIVPFQYFKEAYKKGGDTLFHRTCCNRTRGFKLKENRFSVDIRKKCSSGPIDFCVFTFLQL